MNIYEANGIISTHPNVFYEIENKKIEAVSYKQAYFKLAIDLEKIVGIKRLYLYNILRRSKSLRLIKSDRRSSK